MNVVENAVNSTLVGTPVEFVQKDWDTLTFFSLAASECDIVSGINAAIKRLRGAETTRNVF